MLTRFALCLVLAAPAVVSAQQSILPVITDTLDNPAGTQITINGSGFGPGTPVVSLAGTSLTVVTASNTSIVATVPASITAGSYALSVTNSATHLFGLFSAAIPPAVGPAGMQGPQGSAGRSGSAGSDRGAGADRAGGRAGAGRA